MLLFLKGINRGKYVFRTSNNKTIYTKDIDTEKLIYLEESLKHIERNLNYSFQSFTMDGKKGVIQLLEKLYPNTPIQLCNFHQVKTIITYTTKNPQTDCGKDLKKLIMTLTNKYTTNENNFINDLKYLKEKYKDFLKEKTINPLANKAEHEHKRLDTVNKLLTFKPTFHKLQTKVII